jgi:hypothetical protein
VSFPDPHPGLVIRYAYLWKREHDQGREEGSKDRPCAIVVSVLDDEGEQEAMVLPITHSAPQRGEDVLGRTLADRYVRLRHREGAEVAWEAPRRWLRRKGARPAALIEMARSSHGAENAVHRALQIVL